MQVNRVSKLKITQFSESYNYENSILKYYDYNKNQYGHGLKFFFEDLKKEIENNFLFKKILESEITPTLKTYKTSFKVFKSLMSMLVYDGLSCWDDYENNLNVLNGRLLNFMTESEKQEFYNDSRVRVVGGDFYDRLQKHFKEFWIKEIKVKN
jgi:hypothetical protein